MTGYKCSFCGSIDARFRRYKRVRGYLIFSTHSETSPIAACDNDKFKAGLKTIILNLIFGWWGIHAFFWNIFALVVNSRGGRDVTREVEQLYAAEVEQAKKVIEVSKVR